VPQTDPAGVDLAVSSFSASELGWKITGTGDKGPKNLMEGEDSFLFIRGWTEDWGLFSDSCFPVSGSMVEKPPLISSDKFSQLLLNPQCPPPPPPPPREKEPETHTEIDNSTAHILI